MSLMSTSEPFLPFDDPDFAAALQSVRADMEHSTMPLLDQGIESEAMLEFTLSLAGQHEPLVKAFGNDVALNLVLYIAFITGYRTASRMP